MINRPVLGYDRRLHQYEGAGSFTALAEPWSSTAAKSRRTEQRQLASFESFLDHSMAMNSEVPSFFPSRAVEEHLAFTTSFYASRGLSTRPATSVKRKSRPL